MFLFIFGHYAYKDTEVALILAAIMTISMLPLNVFGISNVSQVTPAAANARTHTITLAMSDFVSAGFSTPVSLNIDLSLGGAAGNVFAAAVGDTTAVVGGTMVSITPGVSPTWAGAVPSFQATIVYNSGRSAQLRVDATGGVITGAPTEWISIDLPIIAINNNATLSAVYNNVTIIENRPLVLAAGAGVTIAAGAARNFQDAVVVPQVTITERVINALNNPSPVTGVSVPDDAVNAYTTIRLVAPLDYIWSTSLAPQLPGSSNDGAVSINTRLGVFGVPVQWAFLRNHGSLNNAVVLANGRHALDIVVNANELDLQGPLANFLEQLQINNLVLMPTAAAPLSGDVNIDVLVGKTWNGGVWPTIGTPSFENATTVFTNHDNFRITNLLVARRGVAGVDVTMASENEPTIRSGRHGNTAIIQLTETVSGAFNTGFLGTPIQFEINQPGVQVRRVEWRLGTSGDFGTEGRVQEAWIPSPEVQNPPTTQFGVNSLVDNVATIFIPNLNQVAVRTIQFRLEVEVEAGYEWKYDGAPIAVTVSGPVLETQTIEVAFVEDPISVALDGDMLQVEVANVFNTIEPTAIGDIIITEAFAGALPRGQVIRLEVASLPDVFWGAPVLMGTTAVVENDTRLTIRQSNAGQNFVEFTILAQSIGNAPASIRFTNNMIMGGIFPGVRYVLAVSGVSGTAPIANGGARIDTAAGQLSLNTQVGVAGRDINRRMYFNAIPYFTDIIEFGGLSGDDAPGDDAYIPPVHPGRQLILGPDMRDIVSAITGEVVEVPFLWELNPVTDQFLVGYVALRTFAENFLSIEPGWDADNSMAVLTSPDSWGNEVTLLIVSENSNASVIRGGVRQDGDIASVFLQGASGPAGSIYAINRGGRLYLPLRFVAETFGYSVRMEGNMVVFS